jgi:hypothetical protein
VVQPLAASSADVYDTSSSYTGATTSEKSRTTYFAQSDYCHASCASSSSKLYAFERGAARIGVGVGYGRAQEDDVAVIGRKRVLLYGGHNRAG